MTRAIRFRVELTITKRGKMKNHICFDRILPGELHLPRPLASIGGMLRAVTPLGKLWINGSTLRVAFLGGTANQQNFVKEHAIVWTQHANLRFSFVNDMSAEIRVSFNEDDGAWSYIGTDAKRIPVPNATLNLGWLDQSVVLHEFGHALGLGHEHQNPDGGIVWNEEAVIEDLSGPPNYWDEETIRHNVLNKYRFNQINGTAFDPQSIMLYAFPARWTQGGTGTDFNEDLSDLDKAFISGANMYPGRSEPEFVELPVFKPVKPNATKADIGKPGEEDLFRFTAATTGTYVVETEGPTDLVMKLFGPNSVTQLIAEDDDGGAGFNSKITANLVPGEYYVQVRHYNRVRGTGVYGVIVKKI